MATWPAYAQFLADGFSVSRENALTRTEMESGPPRQARTRSRVMVARAGTVLIKTNADYQAFIAWYDNDIDAGAAWFDWTDPADGTVKQARIRAGELLQTPIRKLDMWRIALTLETWG